MNVCFFIGHREAPDSLMEELAAAIERHITEYDVREFVVGSRGRFDAMAAQCVREAKKRHPEVMLTLLLAYYPSGRSQPVPQDYDASFYPPGMETVPKRAAIVRANRYMVAHSQFLIAYAQHTASNAAALTAYAEKRAAAGLIRVTRLGRDAASLYRTEIPVEKSAEA